METASLGTVNVTFTTYFDPPAEQDVRVLATSFMMYKIGKWLLY